MADPMLMHQAHMKTAYNYAELSSCVRKKVGALVVHGTSIIDYGYNGTPAGWDNCCELDGKTKPEVIHAEQNAFYKIGKSNRSAEGATLYVTMVPCMGCAMDIIGYGIIEVFYCEEYRLTDGVDYLNAHGITVTQLTI